MFSSAKDAFIQKLIFEHQSSQNTVAAYTTDIEQFIRFINTETQLSKAKLLEFQQHLIMTYSGKTVRRKLSSTTQFIDYLFSEKWISEKPKVEFEKINIKKTLPKTISTQKVSQIRQAIVQNSSNQKRDLLIIELLYGLGLRVSEVVGLNKTDIGSECILIHGKGQKDRTLPLTSAVKTLLTAYLYEANLYEKSKDALIKNKNGTRITRQGIQHILKQYADISPHQFRHSIATHLLENNMPLSHIQRFLGHKNLNTTQIYTQTSIQNIRTMLKNTHPRMAA